MRNVGALALAALAGLALPLALAPFDLWPLSLLSVALLFWLLQAATPGWALLLGYAYGIGKYGLGASWVYVSIHEYGNASMPLAALLVALFVLGLACFNALLGWCYARWIRHRQAWLGNALGFAAAFVLLEWLLTWFLTGFPWLFVGYAHLETPLQHLAPIGSVLLVSFAAALCACYLVAAAFTVRRRRRVAALVLAAMPWLAGAAAGGVVWVQPGSAGTAALVQGDVPQNAKWQPEMVESILERYRDLSEPHWDSDLVIWPEAAVTVFRRQADAYLEAMSRRAAANGSGLVLGIPTAQRGEAGATRLFNSVIAIGDGDGVYSKRRLVPFGDYVPFEGLLRGLIDFFDLPMSYASPGPWEQAPLEAAGRRLALAVCYEIAYPEVVREPARRAEVIVTVSNDTWFGRSIGPHQHMQKARMRALENGRYLLRSTNNGITAIVDPAGRITQALPQFETGVLRGEFRDMHGETLYARIGTMPLVALLLLAAASVSAPARRMGRRGR